MSSIEDAFADQRVTGSTDLDGRHWLGIVARRTYSLVQDKFPVSLKRSLPPVASGITLFGLIEADDIAIVKPFSDVILTATIEGRRDARTVDTRLIIGSIKKEVRVYGRRWLRRASHDIEVTAPEPLDVVPIEYERAFGGRDDTAESLRIKSRRVEKLDAAPEIGGSAYPRNPWGIGYLISGGREHLVGKAVAQLEDPNDPLTLQSLLPQPQNAWPSRPVAATYAPQNRFIFPRSQHAVGHGVIGFRLKEVAEGTLDPVIVAAESGSSTMNDRFFQCASSGLGNVLLSGTEQFALLGFDGRTEELKSALPADIPELSLTLPGVGKYKLHPQLKTVLFEMDQTRVSATWAGRVEVLMPYSKDDIAQTVGEVFWPCR